MAGSDKTEKPTPKKQRDARKEGKVPRSKDLSAALVYLGMLGLLALMGARTVQAFQRPFFHVWRNFLDREITVSVASQLMLDLAWNVILLASIPLLLTMVLSLVDLFCRAESSSPPRHFASSQSPSVLPAT